ncbi:helix-turn-helix domain-containing protein [Clostridium cochlearium]|uniref:helix-turn-helix domain-containing protein n=1 Tax=Clostridium cochlearium TaxID=1494 RepID=UPI00179CA36F|nr:helix-turn-helix domain-containing protein [Clostridium cochlearium]NMA57715.1 helix-turn-helix domain-containing protein [Clostridium cochlearium]
MELLTIKEVAAKLKVNRNTVYNLIKAGHITALKLGALKVTEKELDKFIETSTGKDYSDLKNVTELKRD